MTPQQRETVEFLKQHHAKHGIGEFSSTVAKRFGISRQTAGIRLRRMRDAGLVHRAANGCWVVGAAAPAMKLLQAW